MGVRLQAAVGAQIAISMQAKHLERISEGIHYLPLVPQGAFQCCRRAAPPGIAFTSRSQFGKLKIPSDRIQHASRGREVLHQEQLAEL